VSGRQVVRSHSLNFCLLCFFSFSFSNPNLDFLDFLGHLSISRSNLRYNTSMSSNH
jgi:hypothetical protein